jgi:hypothetical protein
MPKFRKRPVVVEAVQWDGVNHEAEMRGLIPAGTLLPWVRRGDSLWIATLEGTMEARVGDYIIRGVNGEFYPCKPDIFAATYEAAE